MTGARGRVIVGFVFTVVTIDGIVGQVHESIAQRLHRRGVSTHRIESRSLARLSSLVDAYFLDANRAKPAMERDIDAP